MGRGLAPSHLLPHGFAYRTHLDKERPALITPGEMLVQFDTGGFTDLSVHVLMNLLSDRLALLAHRRRNSFL
jgi:hypothetical protein